MSHPLQPCQDAVGHKGVRALSPTTNGNWKRALHIDPNQRGLPTDRSFLWISVSWNHCRDLRIRLATLQETIVALSHRMPLVDLERQLTLMTNLKTLSTYAMLAPWN